MKKYLDFRNKFKTDCLVYGRDFSVFKTILSHVLDCPYDRVLFYLDEPISEENLGRLEEISKRYLEGEPIQYILGYTYFYGLKIMVDQNVLIPRFETEELVALVLDEHKEEHLRVLDLGTGSGCIASAIKTNRPLWDVYASDISSLALEVAKKNFKNLNLDVKTYQSDFLKDIQEDFDIIISNPPYIYREDKEVDQEVRDYEPSIALFTSDLDGIDSYRKILEQLKDRTFKEVYFECSYKQKEALKGLLLTLNYRSYEFKGDINNKNRFLKVYTS